MTDSNEKISVNKIIDVILEWLEVIIMSAFAVILVFTFILRIVVVEGNSMLSTLYNDDKLLITNLFYTPDNGDIVVLNSDALNKTIVKRVIATENQTVLIDYNNRTVSVDGKVLDEYDYIKEFMTENKDDYNMEYYNEQTQIYEYTVPENCVFVLGDNRNHSTDSRSFGCVSVDSILGKVFLRISSPYGDVGFVE